MSSGIPNWPTAGAPTTGTPPSANLINLVNYYVARLIYQYSDKPNAQRLIAIFSDAVLMDDLATQLLNAFNLSTAVGPQLDILAKYIGVPRNSNTPGTIDYFGLALYGGGGSVNGLNDYSALGLNGFIFELYDSSGIPTTDFTDIQFRFVLGLQIALNHFDGTLSYIQDFLGRFFPDQITVVDNLDMTMTYHVVPGFPLSNSTLENFLPRPMGVGITVSSVATSLTRVTTAGDRRVTTGGDVRITVNT